MYLKQILEDLTRAVLGRDDEDPIRRTEVILVSIISTIVVLALIALNSFF